MAANDGSDFRSLEVSSIRKLVYAQLKDMILTNRVVPGQQLVIDKLARQMGVSQTPIREALNALATEGLVSIERYKNVVVSTIDEQDVRDVYSMRILLEGWAIAQAVGKITPQQIDEIEARIARVRGEIEQANLDDFLQCDLTMHDMITNLVENRLFNRILQLIGNQSTRIRSLVEVMHPVSTMQQSLDEHCAILAALRANDPQQASVQMEAHLKSAAARTIEALAKLPEFSSIS